MSITQGHDEGSRPRQDQQAAPEPVDEARRQVEDAAKTVQRRVAQDAYSRRGTLLRGRALLLVYAVAIIAFGALALAAHSFRLLPGDVVITRDLQQFNNPIVFWLMAAVSWFGYGVPSTTIFVLVALILWVVRLRLEAVFVVLTLTGDFLNLFLKLVVNRHRPTANLVHVVQLIGGPSFPSGHVMHYTVFYGFLAFVVAARFHRSVPRNLVVAACIALIVLVGPSRVYLGEHWPSDVLGAYLIGGVWLGLLWAAYVWVQARYVVLARPPWVERRPIDSPTL
ncbi:MAG: hypothetical protein PVSMB4_01170 [Ktedonobacterales bacterium]